MCLWDSGIAGDGEHVSLLVCFVHRFYDVYSAPSCFGQRVCRVSSVVALSTCLRVLSDFFDNILNILQHLGCGSLEDFVLLFSVRKKVASVFHCVASRWRQACTRVLLCSVTLRTNLAAAVVMLYYVLLEWCHMFRCDIYCPWRGSKDVRLCYIVLSTRCVTCSNVPYSVLDESWKMMRCAIECCPREMRDVVLRYVVFTTSLLTSSDVLYHVHDESPHILWCLIWWSRRVF